MYSQGKSALFRYPHTINIDGEQGKVLKFFWQAYQLVYPELKPYLLNSTKKYIITGHSLGGAIASIHSILATQFNKVSNNILNYKTFEYRQQIGSTLPDVVFIIHSVPEKKITTSSRT